MSKTSKPLQKAYVVMVTKTVVTIQRIFVEGATSKTDARKQAEQIAATNAKSGHIGATATVVESKVL